MKIDTAKVIASAEQWLNEHGEDYPLSAQLVRDLLATVAEQAARLQGWEYGQQQIDAALRGDAIADAVAAERGEAGQASWHGWVRTTIERFRERIGEQGAHLQALEQALNDALIVTRSYYAQAISRATLEAHQEEWKVALRAAAAGVGPTEALRQLADEILATETTTATKGDVTLTICVLDPIVLKRWAQRIDAALSLRPTPPEKS